MGEGRSKIPDQPGDDTSVVGKESFQPVSWSDAFDLRWGEQTMIAIILALVTIVAAIDHWWAVWSVLYVAFAVVVVEVAIWARNFYHGPDNVHTRERWTLAAILAMVLAGTLTVGTIVGRNWSPSDRFLLWLHIIDGFIIFCSVAIYLQARHENLPIFHEVRKRKALHAAIQVSAAVTFFCAMFFLWYWPPGYLLVSPVKIQRPHIYMSCLTQKKIQDARVYILDVTNGRKNLGTISSAPFSGLERIANRSLVGCRIINDGETARFFNLIVAFAIGKNAQPAPSAFNQAAVQVAQMPGHGATTALLFVNESRGVDLWFVPTTTCSIHLGFKSEPCRISPYYPTGLTFNNGATPLQKPLRLRHYH